MYKIIDLRNDLGRKKFALKSQTRVYMNDKFIGFTTPTREKLVTGISFVRLLKNRFKTERSGDAKYYHGANKDLNSAITFANKFYSTKIPREGWKKFLVTHYNTTTTEEIINQLKVYDRE